MNKRPGHRCFNTGRVKGRTAVPHHTDNSEKNPPTSSESPPLPSGIVHADTLAPGTSIMGWFRMSGSVRVRKSMSHQKQALEDGIARIGLVCPYSMRGGQESGLLSQPRPIFQAALDSLRRYNLDYGVPVGMLAHDMYRLVRPRAFDKDKNPMAPLTDDDLAEFLERYGHGIPFFATIVRPDATPQEVHRIEIRRGQQASHRRPGRRSAIADDIFRQILYARQFGADDFNFGSFKSDAWIAKFLGIDRQIVRKALDQLVPGYWLAPGYRTRWRDILDPVEWWDEFMPLDTARDEPAGRNTVKCYCEYCGRIFEAKRSHALYCSDAHRQADRRKLARRG